MDYVGHATRAIMVGSDHYDLRDERDIEKTILLSDLTLVGK